MARVTASMLPIDHPLLLLVAEPRRLRFGFRDGVWVRLVDVEAALAARSYEPSDSVVIEVHDEFARGKRTVARWSNMVGRTKDDADLRCEVSSVLASAYLGGFSWSRLSSAPLCAWKS